MEEENKTVQPSAPETREKILEVSHLKQFFKLSATAKTKAVNDVSFDVYAGEVFGLVGESGCGKTTTGRSIIKLYKITGGQIKFKGQVISAGTRWNEKEIKWTTIRGNQKIKTLKQEMASALSDADEGQAQHIRDHYEGEIEKIQKHIKEVSEFQTARIKAHRYDDKNGAKAWTKKRVEETKALYAEKEKEFKASNPNAKAVLNFEKEKVTALFRARHDRLMNRMQMIFQDPISSLNPRMTVREIIAEGLTIQGIRDKATVDAKVIEVLNLVGLVPEHATRYPHEFSGGQRQRIGIARAIVMNPELIIADEPISALDVSIQAQVINLLNEIRHKMGLSILFIAHDLSVVKYFCDRIGVMYFGRMVELATSEELFKHPLHPYTKSLLSAIPLPDPHYEKHRVRITYNAAASHDYSVLKPSFREILPGHFVYCNDPEFEAYKKEIEEDDRVLAEQEAAEKAEDKAN